MATKVWKACWNQNASNPKIWHGCFCNILLRPRKSLSPAQTPWITPGRRRGWATRPWRTKKDALAPCGRYAGCVLDVLDLWNQIYYATINRGTCQRISRCGVMELVFFGAAIFFSEETWMWPHEEGEKVGSSNGHELERFFWHIAWLVPTTVGDPKVEMLKLFWEHRINSRHPRKHFAFRVEKPFIINIYIKSDL